MSLTTDPSPSLSTAVPLPTRSAQRIMQDPGSPDSASRSTTTSPLSEDVPADSGTVAQDERLCVQCGLPNPRRGTVHYAGRAFCCHGCVMAYCILEESGLEEALQNPELPFAGKERARPTGNRYEEFDDPAFLDRYATHRGAPLNRSTPSSDASLTADSATTQGDPIDPERESPATSSDIDASRSCSIELWLEGVHCASCVRLLEGLPSYLPGVTQTRLNVRTSVLELTWDRSQIGLAEIASTMDSLGYPSHPLRGKSRRELQKRHERQQLLHLAIAGALAGNTMLIAIALYAGAFEGMALAHMTLFRWVSMGLGIIALVFPGRTFFRGAWAALRTRTSHMDLPIALGLGAGGIAGTINTIRGVGEIYFDSLSVLVFLLLVGRWLQMRQQRRAGDAIELLYTLTPSNARRIEEGGVRIVPVEAVRPGELVEIRAGDSVPVDGTIVEGESSVDNSLLTGESVPVTVNVGDSVAAGVVNRAARLVVRVEATGESTRVGKLMKLVESAAADKAPVVQLADRLGAWFVAIVIVLATFTFIGWKWHGSDAALEHAIALLIVACPCALGLATPLTLAVAIGRAAKHRILIRGADVIEGLARAGTIFLDKTGTLTEGRFQLVDWMGDDRFLAEIAAMQRQSSHPIAQATVEGLVARSQQADLGQGLDVTDVDQDPLGGIRGKVGQHHVAIGNLAFMEQESNSLDSTIRQQVEREASQGRTPVVISIDGVAMVVASYGDRLRSDAVAAIQDLQHHGWNVGILSGDHPHVVQQIAAAVGIAPNQAHGGMTPEDKLRVVRDELAMDHRVAMVGDGVNDAAALAAATVGIAVKTGAEASLEAAPVYLASDGLLPIVSLINAARRTMNAVRTGLIVSLLYNAIAVGLAVAGLISPLVAAVLMPLSSLTVVALSFSPSTFADRS